MAQKKVIQSMMDTLNQAIANAKNRPVPNVMGQIPVNVVALKGDKGDQGEPGYNPVRGLDYYTREDESKIIDTVFSKIRVPQDGYTPVKGVDYFDGKDVDMVQIIRDVLEMIPKPENGKDAVLDIDAISNEVIKRIPLELNIVDVKNKLEGLTGDDRLDAKAIKNLPNLVQIKGGGGGIAEIIAGSNISVSKSGNKVTINSTSTGSSGSGDVTKVGTPVNNQVGIWTGDGTLEGDAKITFDGTNLMVNANITNLADITFKTGATGGTVRTGTSAADKFELQAYDVNGGFYQKVLVTDAGNTPTLEVFADSFAIWDNTDETKKLQFLLSGGTTGVTTTIAHSPTANRTITFPDATGTLVLTSSLSSYLPLAGGTMTGNLLFTDNTYDIGASGATRPRTGYFGTSLISPLVTTPSLTTSSGAMTITPAAGSNLNVALSTTGDLAVNTDDLVVDTSSGFVGIGTTAPESNLHVWKGNAGTATANANSLIALENSTAAHIEFITPNTTGGHGLVWTDTDAVAVGAILYGHDTNILSLKTNGATKWNIASAGHFLAETDNSYDIGASGATRPRTGYFGTSVVVPTLTVSSAVTTTTGAYFNLTSADVSQPFTASVFPTNQYGQLRDRATTTGGLAIIGASDVGNTNGVNIQAYVGATTTTVPAMYFYGAKSDGGTGATVLAATEVVLRISNYTSDLIDVLGNGNITLAGSLGLTGTRVSKGWFTDIESTNMPTVGGTAILTSLTAPQFTTIELGHATDTTLSRVSAGVIAVEGVTIPTISSTSTFTNKRTNPRLVTAASYTTDTGTSLDVSTCDQFEITAQAGALLFNAPGGTPLGGQKLTIRIKDNATARALTWNAVFRAMGTALPSTTVLSKTLYLGFIYNATDTKWDLVASAQEA